jgi:hypothetical protein
MRWQLAQTQLHFANLACDLGPRPAVCEQVRDVGDVVATDGVPVEPRSKDRSRAYPAAPAIGTGRQTGTLFVPNLPALGSRRFGRFNALVLV